MQKNTSHHAGWKYTVSALALSVAMAPVVQAASALRSPGKLETKETSTNREERTTGLPNHAISDTLVATKTKVLDGRIYTFEKRTNPDGDVITMVILDEKGNEVSERALPQISQVILEPKLKELIQSRTGRRQTHKVVIALTLPLTEPTEKPQSGEVEVGEDGAVTFLIDGRQVSETELDSMRAAEERARGEQAVERFEERGRLLEEWARRHGLEKHEGIEQALESTSDNVILDLTAKEIEALVDSQDDAIRGIELYKEPKDTIIDAMEPTGILDWALPYPLTRGNDIGIYMTESGCADESRFAEYTRLAGSETNHSQNVGGIIKSVAPESYLYCRGGAVLPTFFDLYASWFPGWILDWFGVEVLDVPILVVNRSNGTAADGTDYITLDRDWDNFIYLNQIPVFNAAGNEGDVPGSEFIVSPAKGLNVAAVGAYDDNATVTGADDTIAAFSSFVDPETGNEKPEISAPGVTVTAGGFTMSGTSMASPHAAAFAADIMSQSTFVQSKPYLLNAKMIAGATDIIAGDPDAIGAGGIDFRSTHYHGWNFWVTGNNSDFASLDAADGSSDGYIEREVYIPSSYDAVRIAISWESRGTYVYDHRTDAHPIGMDYDLRVYNPSGAYLGGSYSWDNGSEKFEFEPTTSGTYTFKINRYANRDTSNNIRLGIAVNFFNY